MGRRRSSYKNLTLAQLRSFGVVCRQGGYTAAARELLLTTPAVWEQMQALERYYGRPLFERRGKSLRPTADGELLLDMIQPLLAGLDSTKAVLQQQDGALPRQLTLATNLRVLSEEVSGGLRRFQRSHQQVRLRVFYTGNDVDQPILSGEADVGLTLEPSPEFPCSMAVVYEPAGEVDFLLVMPPRHALLRQRTLHLRHILKQPLVLGKPGGYSRRRFEEILHRDNLTQEPFVAVETGSDECTLSCVRAGLGVGFTVGTGQGHLYRGLGVRSLRHVFGSARVGFLWKRGARVAQGQRELAEALRASLAVQK